MLLTGNPMGAAYIAQGGLSFGKGNGFQIASQLLGLAGAGSTLLSGGGASPTGAGAGPGNDYPNESGGGLGFLMAAHSDASSSKSSSTTQRPRKQWLQTCTVSCYAHYIRGAFDASRPDIVQVPFSTMDTGVQPGEIPLFNFYAEEMIQPGTSQMINPTQVYIQVETGSYSSGRSTIGLTGTLSKDLSGNVSFEGYVSGVSEPYNFNRPGWQNAVGRATPGREFLIEWVGHRKVTYP
jgi:hypothetical protein